MIIIESVIKLLIAFKRKCIRLIYTFKVKVQAAEVKGLLVVNGKSSVHAKTFLGNNVNFNGMRIEGLGKVLIGDNFHSGPECLMISSYHNYDGGNKIPYDNTYIHKQIIVENNVWLGSRVIILAGVTIGEGAIIQAGSVVVNNIPPCSIAGGSPAKVFKYRDLDHYNRLKRDQMFH